MGRLDKTPLSRRQEESMAALAAANDGHVRILEQQKRRAREMIETVRIMTVRTVEMRETSLRTTILPGGGLVSCGWASEE